MTRWVGMITWEDVPHLTREQKDELFKSIPPYQRDARSKGIPQLGSGLIYPVPESSYVVDDFEIPKHWPRSYGLDVGWNCTAAVWGARDLESGVDYLYSVHKQGEEKPSTHAVAIRARGSWIKGVIDPAARGRGQDDGNQLIQQYTDLGLKLIPADNQVEAGLYDVWEALSSGRLKVFRRACQPWLAEVRLYRRDDKGKIVKKNDHLMDATRYWKRSGVNYATCEGKDIRRDVMKALGILPRMNIIKEYFWEG